MLSLSLLSFLLLHFLTGHWIISSLPSAIPHPTRTPRNRPQEIEVQATFSHHWQNLTYPSIARQGLHDNGGVFRHSAGGVGGDKEKAICCDPGYAHCWEIDGLLREEVGPSPRYEVGDGYR